MIFVHQRCEDFYQIQSGVMIMRYNPDDIARKTTVIKEKYKLHFKLTRDTTYHALMGEL